MSANKRFLGMIIVDIPAQGKCVPTKWKFVHFYQSQNRRGRYARIVISIGKDTARKSNSIRTTECQQINPPEPISHEVLIFTRRSLVVNNLSINQDSCSVLVKNFCHAPLVEIFISMDLDVLFDLCGQLSIIRPTISSYRRFASCPKV